MKKTKKQQKNPENEDPFTVIAGQMANLLIEELPQSPLISKEHQKDKLEMGLKTYLQDFFTKIRKGTEHIFTKLVELSNDHPDLLSEEITNDLEKFAIYSNQNSDEESTKKLFADLQNNKSLKEIYHLSDATIRAFYQAASEIYQEKHYVEAAEAFSILVILDPDVYNFWFGLGNSEYFCDQYDQALTAYAMAIQLNPLEPLNYVYSANCYEALHEYTDALHSLEYALYVMDLDPSKYEDIYPKVIEQKQFIERELQ